MSTEKIVVLGDGGVGKSCLTVQFCRGFFTMEYDPTIENLYRKQVTVGEDTCYLEIYDTAGQEDYAAMRDQHILQGRGFMLVYSITSRNSFLLLSEFKQSIIRVTEKDNYPTCVIGNKCDLEKGRQVSYTEGKDYANKISASFFETSAKTRYNVEECFFKLVGDMRKYKTTDNDANTHAGGGKRTGRCIIL